jgi:type IV pilus assembly protein PilN
MEKKINLYPQEAIGLQLVAKRMLFALGIAAGVAVLISILAYTILGAKEAAQQSRLDFLGTEIKVLDKQIKEIAEIQEKTNVLLGRKKVVEKLQFNRGQAVLLLNELIRLSPDGIQMRSLEQKNETLKIVGWALSNANVSQFMKNMEDSPKFEPPTLVEIKAVAPNQTSAKVQEFQLSVKMPAEKDAENQPVKVIQRVPTAPELINKGEK